MFVIMVRILTWKRSSCASWVADWPWIRFYTSNWNLIVEVTRMNTLHILRGIPTHRWGIRRPTRSLFLWTWTVPLLSTDRNRISIKMYFRLWFPGRHAEKNSVHLAYRGNGFSRLGVERSLMSRYVFIHLEYVVYYRHISPQLYVPHFHIQLGGGREHITMLTYKIL